MSVVTNVILTFPLEEEESILRAIDAFDGFRHQVGFGPAVEKCGGSKYLEHNVLIGAFNHLPDERLKAHLAALPWQEPRHVRLMLCEQEEDAFTCWRLNAEREWVRDG